MARGWVCRPHAPCSTMRLTRPVYLSADVRLRRRFLGPCGWVALPGSPGRATNIGEDSAAPGAGSICRACTALSTSAVPLIPRVGRHARVLSPGKDSPRISSFRLLTRCLWHETWTPSPTSFQTSSRPGAAEDRASSGQADGVDAATVSRMPCRRHRKWTDGKPARN